MPDLNLVLTTTQNFLLSELNQSREQLRTLLIRPPKSTAYHDEIDLLMKSYQVQQSSLDKIAAWWGEELWGYERNLIGVGLIATTVLLTSITGAILVGALFIGLSQLLSNHFNSDVARKERICKEISTTQKALEESLVLIKKHEANFKATINDFKGRNQILAEDNAVIHQQNQNLTTENKRLSNLFDLTKKSMVDLREQYQHLINSTKFINTEVQDFLAKGCKESTNLQKLLGTLVHEFSEYTKTVVGIKDKLINILQICQQPQQNRQKIDIAAIERQTNAIGAEKEKELSSKLRAAQNLGFESNKIANVNP